MLYYPFVEYIQTPFAFQQSKLFRKAFNSGQPITAAIIGDSTTCGYGATPGIINWSVNGLAYGYLNNGWGPNWQNNGNNQYIETDVQGMMNQSSINYYNIPTAAVLLDKFMKTYNSNNFLHNFGGSGWDAANHVLYNSVAALAGNNRKPTLVFINIGINNAKVGTSQMESIQVLINQCLTASMTPVLVLEHNVAVWDATEKLTPSQWSPMPYWWSDFRPKLKALAFANKIDIIDLGNDNQSIDIRLLYDPFHPSYIGYQEIFKRYKEWFLRF
jgi:lysophospholipase L1-like esterase